MFGGSSAIGVDMAVPGMKGTEKWFSIGNADGFRRGEEGVEGQDGNTRVKGPSEVSHSPGSRSARTSHVFLDIFVAP